MSNNNKVSETENNNNRDALVNSGIVLNESESAYFDVQQRLPTLPVRIPEYYRKLILSDPTGALRKMAIPQVEEFSDLPYETADPLHEESFEPVSRCIHRYKDRVLLLVTDQCAMYCRYCFRRRFTGDGTGILSQAELENIREYLIGNPSVHEVILSGGDPLMLPDGKLCEILELIQSVGRPIVIRLSTRIPAVMPGRITARLIAMLGQVKNLWLVLHINHPAEITDEFLDAVIALSDAGILLVSQTVLLRGVNDSKEILTQLFHQLLESRVKPYYLFQGDLASGTSHFRMNLKAAIDLYRNLRSTVSGLAMPSLAVDLPGGGGKILLHSGSITGEEDGEYLLRDYEDGIFRYPVEH